jgi:hypothetical protein
MWRKMEALRDRIMYGIGTEEPFVGEDLAALQAVNPRPVVAMHWRKPLSIAEVNRMAPTVEMKQRAGRP